MLKAFRYYGAKQLMFKNILPYLEIEHKIYVEVFGGSAFILLNKKKSELEIYNDIYSELVNFFRVVRNKAKLRRLQQFIDDSIYSREEFNHFKKTISNTPVDWKRAAKFYYVQTISFSGNGEDFICSHKNYSKLLFKRAEKLDLIRKRLKYVILENLPFERLLDNQDSDDTLFYLDPPYMHETREQSNQGKNVKRYKFEMNDSEHKKLIIKILLLKGKVILSGYRNELYDSLLEYGFIRKDFEVDNPTKKAINGKTPRAIECLYLSPHFEEFEKRRNLFFKT